MKVLFVVSSLNNGGAQRVASNLSMHLPAGYESDFLLNETADMIYPHTGRIFDLGMPRVDDRGKLGYQLKVFFRRLKWLRRLKRSGEYSAVFSFMDSANVANILTGKKNCRVIASVHCALTRNSTNPNYRLIVFPLVRLLYKYADRVIAVSEGVKKDLEDNLGYREENLVTIYNGFDIDSIIKDSLEPVSQDDAKLLDSRPVLATMGRLCRQKAYGHLIRAMKLVVEEYPECRLLIMGEGPDEQYLKELTEVFGLNDNVVFTGFLSNPFRILRNSDIYVMSSIYEGLPSALIEACALGVPCVSTDFHSGAREILAPGLDIDDLCKDRYIEAEYGILTPVCDDCEYDALHPITAEEKMLAEAIIHLLKDEALRKRYSESGAECAGRFDADTMAEKWMALAE